MTDMFSFHLSDSFLDGYKDVEPDWGWKDAAGNSIGELTFVRTYSRVKEDGTKEKWWEVCKRVIEGMYSIQKDHCLSHRLEWNGNKAQASAQEAFDRMFQFKWTPPGRGLAQMGTPLVMEHRNVASLLNCGFISTGDMDRHDPGYSFAWLTEALMLGIGVGFDTLGGSKFDDWTSAPTDEVVTYVIPDTREGWAISVGKLVNSYLKSGKGRVEFDYSEIRPYGTPIKTFGGTASGPEPLQEGHEQIRGVLEKHLHGEQSGSTTITDIANIIGTFVVAGNARRSAELALGQPDDEDFINLKNHEVFPDRPWAYMSNNSVSAKVGMDYSHLVKNTVVNGEPGYVWLDVTRAYGRLVDAPDYKDSRVSGFNPCVTADTWVQTTEGPRKAGSLIGKQFTALVNGKPYESYSEGFFLTANDSDVYEIVTSEGYSANVTKNHKILTSNRGWTEAKDLVQGDKIVINDHGQSTWAGAGDSDMGYLLGLLWGDGTFSSKGAVLSVWGSESETAFVRNKVENILMSMPHRSDFSGWTRIASRNEWRITTAALTSLAAIFGMTPGSKKIGDEIETASSEFYRGFLRGAFYTDGHTEGSSTRGGVSVRLSQSDRSQLVAVQRMLARLGMYSKIYRGKGAGVQILPNSSGGHSEYNVSASYRLVLTGKSMMEFARTIGFGGESTKDAILLDKTSVMSRGPYAKPFEATFEALVFSGVEDVYDVNIHDIHAFDANGLYVHNCVEQPLESSEMCCLTEVHLNRAESLQDFLATLKFAYLYGKTVTLLTSPWPKTNAVMLRNRRIGLSTTGVAGFVEANSLAEYRQWADTGYRRVSELDVEYSEWMGIRESIRKTTVKPSGSVSLLSGATPGVHWAPGGEYFLRAIRFGVHDDTWKSLEDCGYKVEDDVYSPNTKVVYFPLKSEAGRAESEVSIYEKAHLAAEAQKYWSDNGVSVTISFNDKTEAEDVPKILRMYEGQFKAVSFLPMSEDKVYAQMPYTRLTQEGYQKEISGISRLDDSTLYGHGTEAVGESYCTTDACELPKR